MIPFAYRGVYNIHHAVGPQDHDFIEELQGTTLWADTGFDGQDICMQDVLQQAVDAPIGKLPAGIHVVWAVGYVEFGHSTSYDGDDYWEEVHVETETWKDAQLHDLLTVMDEEPGIDLSTEVAALKAKVTSVSPFS
jgi:hypothetical protein